MDADTILLECEEHMTKTLDYLRHELRGVRTGRASTGLVEYVKVEAYGASTDLRNLAGISVPEPTQIQIKPFDPGTTGDIVKALERADLGLNPQSDGKVIRLNVPTLSGERRKQLAGQVRSMGENAKVAIRNARRDANKQVDAAEKDKDSGVSEDDAHTLKDEINDLTKKYEVEVESLVEAKTTEIMEV